jgi:hypothetical protein
MHFHINMTYLALGLILIALGFVARRFLAKKPKILVAPEKPMQIGYHVGMPDEEPDQPALPEPEPLAAPITAKAPSGPSPLTRILGSFKRPAKAPQPTTTPVMEPAEPQPTFRSRLSTEERTLAIEARVNNVPKKKNPLRFSTKRIAEPAPAAPLETPPQNAEPLELPEPVAPEAPPSVAPLEHVAIKKNGTVSPIRENNYANIPTIKAPTLSVAAVTDSLIAHVLEGDADVAPETQPIDLEIPTIPAVAEAVHAVPPVPVIEKAIEPEEEIPLPIVDAHDHHPVVDDIAIEDPDAQTEIPATFIEPILVPAADLEELVIPSSTLEEAAPEPEDGDVPTIATRDDDDDDDDGPIDFFGTGSLDETERKRLLEEMEEEEIAQAQLEEELTHDSHDEIPIPLVSTPSAIALNPRVEPTPEVLIASPFKWTTFMGEDAQALDATARANLILMLRNMRDAATCMPILMDAFDEELPEELRPNVLEAMASSYSGENLRPLYEYCLEYGSEREKEIAAQALAAL